MTAKITCRTRVKDLLEEIDFPRVVVQARPVGDKIILGLLRLPRFNIEAMRTNFNFKSDLQQLFPFFAVTFNIWGSTTLAGTVPTWLQACIILFLFSIFVSNTILVELHHSSSFLLHEGQRRLARYVRWAEEAVMAITTGWAMWYASGVIYELIAATIACLLGLPRMSVTCKMACICSCNIAL